MAGRDAVDVDQARQHLGDLLHDRAGERRRAGGPAWPAASSSTGMPARTAASRQRQASSANFSGGTTKQQDMDDERPRPPRVLAAGDQMQHRDRLVDVLGLDEAGADMLAWCPAMQA